MISFSMSNLITMLHLTSAFFFLISWIDKSGYSGNYPLTFEHNCHTGKINKRINGPLRSICSQPNANPLSKASRYINNWLSLVLGTLSNLAVRSNSRRFNILACGEFLIIYIHRRRFIQLVQGSDVFELFTFDLGPSSCVSQL